MVENIKRFEDDPKMGSDRNFGLVFAAVFFIISAFPLIDGGVVRIWALVVAAAFLVISFVIPKTLKPLNVLWFKFGLVLHNIVNPIIMGFMLFVVITPMGLVMRLLGKDLLRMKIMPNEKTYWIERPPSGPDGDSLKNQF